MEHGLPNLQDPNFGRYTLIRLLAQGGMGEVYLAKHTGIAGFERQLVIKKILPHLAEDESFVKRFIDEARLVMNLSHANIVQVFDTGKEAGSYFIAMEYVDGADLRVLLKRGIKAEEPLPMNLALYILAEVCAGLDYAHHRQDEKGLSLGIVHRDVSPSNVMLSKDGAVKLVDFGVAKATSGMNQSLSGSLRGKVRYMSPEQARGDQINAKSDIFSLGVMGYELLTGTRLFEAETDLKMIDLVRQADIPSLRETHPEIPVPIASLIEACLDNRPESRPNADNVRRDLLGQIHELTAGEGITGKDMGAFVRNLLGRPSSPPSLDEALGLEMNPGFPAAGQHTATVMPTDGTPAHFQQPEFNSSSWPSTEVTAQQAQNVRSLTSLVRVLVAAVVVLVGINIFFFVGNNEPGTEEALQETKIPSTRADKKQGAEDPETVQPIVEPKPEAVPSMVPSSSKPKETVTEKASNTTPAMEGKRRDALDEESNTPRRKDLVEQVPGKKITVVPAPPGARIYVNGKSMGKGVQEIVIPHGESVRVSARDKGFKSGQVTLTDKSPSRVSLNLSPESVGRLRFRFFPANAAVSLNGKLLDLNGKNLVDTELPVGEHVIELKELEGKRKLRKTFTIQENQTQQMGTLKL